MKLYLAPGACSLSDHIAMCEAGLDFECIKVDIPTRRTEDGGDFAAINPKGYVPALVLDDGQVLTENAAILSWVAERAPALAVDGALGRIRLIEMLSFIAAELHKPFIRSFFPVNEGEKQMAVEVIAMRLAYAAGQLKGDYLFGSRFSVADAYLFVMLRWAEASAMEIPPALKAFMARVAARPAVQRALRQEGLA